MTADSRLNELLSQWEMLRDQGKSASVADLCRTCPELAPELRRRLDALAAMDSVLRLSPGQPTLAAPSPAFFEETRQRLRRRLLLLLVLFLLGALLLVPLTLQNPVCAPKVNDLDYQLLARHGFPSSNRNRLLPGSL